jgi:anti-anti-sigma factor
LLGIRGASVEVDLSTAPAFAAALRGEIDGADSRIVFIDCSAITFMDSSAFQALIYAHRYATEHGHRLVVGNLRPNCNLAIRLCDWNNELTIEPALDSAAAHRGASVSSLSERRSKTKAAAPVDANEAEAPRTRSQPARRAAAVTDTPAAPVLRVAPAMSRTGTT